MDVMFFVRMALFGAAAGVLVAISVADVRRRVIPPELLGALLLIWMCVVTAVLVEKGVHQAFAFALTGLAGMAFMGVFLLALSLGYEKLRGRQSLGGGDIKLLAVLGLYLGPQYSLFNLMAACLLAAVVFGLAGKRDFPFGPAISVSSLCFLAFTLV